MNTAGLIEHEALIRLGVFGAMVAAVAAAERMLPRRPWRTPQWRRWLHNFGLLALGVGLLRGAFPLLAVGTAAWAESADFGLLQALELPPAAAIPLALLLLDLLIYGQHRLFHAAPLLWRLHMVHHTDPDFDVSTGARFHPIEIALSMAIKMAAVAVLGAPVVAVILFELLLSATTMFNHGNLTLPAGLDRIVRLVVVTPDMHRVHHSIRPIETNSNFGFNFPWWDRLFGSYRSQPAEGHRAMAIGLEHYPAAETLSFARLLALPVMGRSGAYPAGRYRAEGEGPGRKT